jgi:hypothetical protein
VLLSNWQPALDTEVAKVFLGGSLRRLDVELLLQRVAGGIEDFFRAAEFGTGEPRLTVHGDEPAGVALDGGDVLVRVAPSITAPPCCLYQNRL